MNKKITREKIEFLNKNIDKLLTIHYSCQNLNDKNEGYSPRITSIAILHLDSHTMKSFSIHLEAEISKIPRDEIDNHYDKLEKDMLDNFYSFVKNRKNSYWLHWNMNNINYGFESIAHRYKVLSEKEPEAKIDEERRFNLSSLIVGIYGSNCVDDPKMKNLMKLNGGLHRDFLTGKQEVEAFENKEYFKLHKSTLCKAYWFKKMFKKLSKGKVKVTRYNCVKKFNNLMEHPVVKLLSFIAILVTIYTGALSIFDVK